MNKKRIRQMDLALRRRLADRSAADWLAGREQLLARPEGDSYMQRFAPLFNGTRLRCADVLELVRQVQARVQEQTGVALEMEVKVLR